MIRIRKASENDLPEVIRLQHQLGPQEPHISEEKARQIFHQMQSYPDYTMYVAEDGGVIVGTFVLLIMDKLGHDGHPCGIVEDVVVESERRGQGLGRQMMNAAMEHCRKRGCYKMALSSNLKRTDAHAFYEGLGFTRHGYSFVTEL